MRCGFREANKRNDYKKATIKMSLKVKIIDISPKHQRDLCALLVSFARALCDCRRCCSHASLTGFFVQRG